MPLRHAPTPEKPGHLSLCAQVSAAREAGRITCLKATTFRFHTSLQIHTHLPNSHTSKYIELYMNYRSERGLMERGVRVETPPGGFGATLVATRSFNAGETVLTDAPMFRLPDDDPPEQLRIAVTEVLGNGPVTLTTARVLQLWLTIDVGQRSQMAQTFFATPDNASMTEFLRQKMSDIQQRFPELQSSSVEDLTTALQAWLLTGHATDDEDGWGLYPLGGRANHSCDPNVAFVAGAAPDRLLVYRALRPIGSGEQICFSYLGHSPDLLMPTELRQKRAKLKKFFECGCARCNAPLDPASRGLPCSRPACDGCVTGQGAGWQCSRCGVDVPPPTTAVLQHEEVLVEAALRCNAPLQSEDLAMLSHDEASWRSHWAWREMEWRVGILTLRGGVEGGKEDALWEGLAMCSSYFAYVDARGHPRHFVAARAAEVFACLEALAAAGGAAQHRAAAAAVRECAPFLPALECYYGHDDEHNIRMRAFCSSHCGQCGRDAKSRCSRCRLVGYCTPDCQRAAWKEHKKVCIPAAAVE